MGCNLPVRLSRVSRNAAGIFLRLPYLKFRTDYSVLRSVFWWSNHQMLKGFQYTLLPKNDARSAPDG